MTNTALKPSERSFAAIINETDSRFALRMAIASAMGRHTGDSGAHEQVSVHRGMNTAVESGVVVSERLCLLPDTVDVGILQMRSGVYYPMNIASFHGVAVRSDALGSVTRLTRLFDSA